LEEAWCALNLDTRVIAENWRSRQTSQITKKNVYLCHKPLLQSHKRRGHWPAGALEEIFTILKIIFLFSKKSL